MKHIMTGLVLALTFAAPAQAQQGQWKNFFNESQAGQRSDVCANGMTGLRVKGTWSYLKSIRCNESNATGIQLSGAQQQFGPVISEDRANTEYSCPPGQIAAGMKCSGEWCDDISLACVTVDPNKVKLTQTCAWSPVVSDRGPTEFTVPKNNYVTGIRCAGGWCYQNTLKYCAVQPVPEKGPDVADLQGTWANLCSGAQKCTGRVTSGITTSEQAAKTITNAAKAHLSTTISTSLKFGETGVNLSATAGFEVAHSEASRIARTAQVNQQNFCNVTTDTVGTNIHAVWQWTVTGRLNGNPITIKTCQITCTPDGRSPKYVPGSKEDIGSCQKAPAATQTATPAPAATTTAATAPATPAPATPAPEPTAANTAAPAAEGMEELDPNDPDVAELRAAGWTDAEIIAELYGPAEGEMPMQDGGDDMAMEPAGYDADGNPVDENGNILE